MKIRDRKIGGLELPYVVAEISANHCGSLTLAKELIKAAKWAGADAVKTQCYEPDTITLNVTKPDFIVQGGLWRQRTLYDLYKSAHTPFAWHKELYKVAKDEGITIFSSVFDFSSVDFLEKLGCPVYKIASFEIVDIPLIKYVAETGKPIIISTGMATDEEVVAAYQAVPAHVDVAFLHCTSEYPATVDHAGLSRMKVLNALTQHSCPIGVSDHTADHACVPMMATALGAMLIEKHLKLDHGPKSEDEKFSLTPHNFKEMMSIIKLAHEACLTRPVDKNNPSRQMRRSLYAVADIGKGEEFSHNNVRSIRPGFGLPPKKLSILLGKKSTRAYRKGDPIREVC